MPGSSAAVASCLWQMHVGKAEIDFIHLDTRATIFLCNECCSFGYFGIKLPSLFKMESVRAGMKYCPLTEVTSNTPAGFKRGKSMLGMRILLRVSICFMTSLSFHGCR